MMFSVKKCRVLLFVLEQPRTYNYVQRRVPYSRVQIWSNWLKAGPDFKLYTMLRTMLVN